MSFFEELKRRNVFRVGAAYIVAAWVLAQVVDLVLEYVNAPDWIMLVFMLFVGIGFIVAVIIAWAYEVTPEGIKRESEIDRSRSVVADTGRKLDRIIIGFLAVAVLLLLTDRFIRTPETGVEREAPETTTATAQVNAPEAITINPVVTETGKSIAVLPFVNMSTDVENEFFSDGISEEILNVLASIPELKVAARTSAFAYKGSNTNISDIASELGVNHVLEGSVRKAGNQVRVTAQLIQASDGFHLWSANYDRELTNIFAIQDEIAEAIAEAMKLTLELKTGDSGNLTGTKSLEAYEHYLQGMQQWHLRTFESLPRSINEFEAAIAIDPGFAKAHAGLALAWGVLNGYVEVDTEFAAKNSLNAADRALELDPNNAEAMAIKGVVFRYRHEFSDSEALFKKAIEINPSFASAHQWYGGLLGEMGDPVAGVVSYRKAWSLDPRSRIIGYNLAFRLYGLGEQDEAISLLTSVLEFAPDFPDGLDLMMHLQMFAGECEKADETARRLAVALKKKNPAFDIYRNICQDKDPQLRLQAFETILSWPEIVFADPENPALSYSPDIFTALIHYGLLDELWTWMESLGDESVDFAAFLRVYRTDNGIRVQCDPRARELELKYEIPPPADPVDCS